MDHSPTSRASKKTLLLTGAAGSVGSALIPSLQDAYQLRTLLRPGTPAETVGASDTRYADITDMAAMLDASSGCDAIIHLAGNSDAYANWEDLRGPNIDGVYNVLESARENGVTRVILASSNWVAGGYDRDEDWPIYTSMPPRPGNLYGATKAFAEAIGRYYSDYHGIDVICLRIGWHLEQPHNEMALRMWLSKDDLLQLVLKSLEADVRFGIYYGASANTRLKWDMTNALVDLGYRPHDNSEDFASLIENELSAAKR